MNLDRLVTNYVGDFIQVYFMAVVATLFVSFYRMMKNSHRVSKVLFHSLQLPITWQRAEKDNEN